MMDPIEESCTGTLETNISSERGGFWNRRDPTNTLNCRGREDGFRLCRYVHFAR